MLTEQEKKDTLKHILGSKTFSKSTTSNVLLKFLVEMSIQEEEITASDIGHELFGSKYEHEKSEATVCVNIYHLRKKLDKYYNNEGKNDPVVISIDKGHYKVTFNKKKEKQVLGFRNAATLAIFAAAITLVIIFFVYNKKTRDKIWTGTFKNKHQTTFYLSAVFGYQAVGPLGKSAFHRDVSINSEEELEKRLKDYPLQAGKIVAARYNYITFEDAATINHFSRLFTLNNCEFVVRKADEFLINDIKEQNIIYLSPMRYKTGFSDMFNELSKNLEFKADNENKLTLHYINTQTKIDSVIKIRSGKNAEYAIAAKFKTANNTYQHMFFADHGLGLTAMAEYFTSKGSISTFSGKYLGDTDEFVAIFYVHGKERTNLGLELVFFDENK